MKLTVRLPDALHARPANLLVRLASRFDAEVRISKGACSVSAANILDVLSVGAMKGDEISFDITGPGELLAAAAIRELIVANFDADLVPETGVGGVGGIAVGQAVVVLPRDPAPPPKGTPAEEHARAANAFARVERDLTSLVSALPPGEAELFEPEIAIVRDLAPRVLDRTAAGAHAEDAVRAETGATMTDLVTDARTRLLDALTGTSALDLELTTGAETILVTDALVPSLVASLPRSVVGIVAGMQPGTTAPFTSHAAILARGRGIPLAFVPDHVTAQIATGEIVVVDTTLPPARVWIAPGASLVDDARARRADLALATLEEQTRALASLAHLGVAVRVNVGALRDTIPRSAEGIGLLRTELMFTGRSGPPSEAEQVASVLSLASRAAVGPVVARLFDAGGDKPISWLTPPSQAPEARGIDLLFHHDAILDTQLRALCRAAEVADVRALLPLVRGEDDIHEVRKRTRGGLKIGAMVETPDAVERIDSIAAASDFVCVGTNDLAAFVLGVDRAVAALSLDARVLTLVRRVVVGAHACGKQVTVCGEMAGDERGAAILVGLGVDALSVAPMRVAPIRVLLARTTRNDCEEAARLAESGG